MHVRTAASISGAVALVWLACGPPSINRFAVTPSQVCLGHPVTASWSTSNGAAILHVTPRGDPTTSSNVSGEGSLNFQIFTHTDFELEVRATAGDAGPATQQQSADLFTFRMSNLVGAQSACPSASPVTLSGALAVQSEGLRVTSVAASRALTVQHEGQTATFGGSGGTSDGLRDTALNGVYTFTVEVPANQLCQAGVRGGPSVDVSLRVDAICPELLPGGSRVWTQPTPTYGVGTPSNWSPCGLSGQRCCAAASCDSGLTCEGIGGFCRGGGLPAANPCNDPAAQVQVFGLVDQYGCAGRLIQFQPTTAAQARQCADDYARSIGATASASVVVRHPSWHYTRTNSDGTTTCENIQPGVYDDGAAEQCVRHIQCESTPCASVEAGDCP